MIIKILIYIYFAINIFIAGNFSQDFEWDKSIKHAMKIILTTLGISLFAIPMYVLIWIYVKLKKIFSYLDSIFQISFIYSFYFTDFYLKLDIDTIDAIYSVYLSRAKSKKIKDNIFCRCAEKIFILRDFNKYND